MKKFVFLSLIFLIPAISQSESDSSGRKWIIVPHRSNYLLPVLYDADINQKTAQAAAAVERYQDVEIEFQLSFKILLGKDLIWGNGNLNFGYTQHSAWQFYDDRNSRPFRNTDHEPELFIDFRNESILLPDLAKILRLGLVHQSNGRGEDVLSRSWNRLYADILFESGDFVWSVKPWWRIPVSDSSDDNPGIERYYGYAEIQGQYRWHGSVLSVMLRNNLRGSNNKGALRVGLSFPLYRDFKGYIQYFNGYGSTLLDYNHASHRVGFGIMLSDWF